MALTLFGFHGQPNDFAVTRLMRRSQTACSYLELQVVPLKSVDGLVWLIDGVGRTIGLLVPVVHQGEEAGGYVVKA